MDDQQKTLNAISTLCEAIETLSRAGNAKDAEIVAKKLLAYIEKLE